MFADKSTIQNLIQDLTGFPVTFDPAEVRSVVGPAKAGEIFVHLKSTQALGVDDFVRQYDSGPNLLVTTQSGNRLFIMSVKMESYIATVNAYETLEILRTRLFRPSSLARLRVADMTAAYADTVVELPTEYDHRVISVASLDVHMALRFHEVDPNEDGLTIETYDLTETVG